jgi:hypothetical protein
MNKTDHRPPNRRDAVGLLTYFRKLERVCRKGNDPVDASMYHRWLRWVRASLRQQDDRVSGPQPAQETP